MQFRQLKAPAKAVAVAKFLRKLPDGTAARQIPDGSEIVASMNRAVLNDAGDVEWTELCFCATPLAHERATVLDAHFDNITTEVIQAHRPHPGISFVQYIQELVGRNNGDGRLQ